MSRKNKVNEFVVLPKNIDSLINDLGLSKAFTLKSKKFVYLVIKNALKSGNIYNYVQMPSKYLVKIFGGNYKKAIQPLQEIGLVKSLEFFSEQKGICKRYAISNEVMFDNYYTLSELKNVKVTKDREDDDVYLTELFKKDFNKLNIDLEKLKNLAKIRVKSLSKHDFKINHQIKSELILIRKQNGEFYTTKTSEAIETANLHKKVVIMQEGYAVMVFLDEFLEEKRNSIDFNYNDTLLRIKLKKIYGVRNSTNNRFDTNITNMPSFMVEQIMKDNDLVEIDMRNAQMAFLANMSREVETEDAIKFRNMAFEGVIYDYIKTKFNLRNRNDAKELTFQVVFCSDKKHSQIVKSFGTMFPTIFNFVNDFKKKNGYKEFAIMLQKKESEMFIDGFYKTIKLKGLFCLTKHDSLIIKKSDCDKVVRIIEELLEKLDFKCAMKY